MVRTALNLIGMGEGGCSSLSSRAFNLITTSHVLAGSERLLRFFPDYHGKKIAIEGKLSLFLDDLFEESAESTVTILASGDPLFFGIGSLVTKRFGVEHVTIVPHVSSMQMAFAAVGWSWTEAYLGSYHGRDMAGLVNVIQHHATVGLFTDPINPPRAISLRLVEFNDTQWDAVVCENLEGPEQRIRHFSILELSEITDISSLNVVLLKRHAPQVPKAAIPFLDEDDFAHRSPLHGLITKREIRALSLACLGIHSKTLLWDVGAGSGSVAIEAAKIATQGKAYAVECDPEGVELCEFNIRHHHTDNVTVIKGLAPDALRDLPDPDAVFVGGSKGALQNILGLALDRLRLGGRLVVNAVTLENVNEAYQFFKQRKLQPNIIMVNISRGKPLAGKYTRYDAMNPIHIFSIEKTHAEP